MAKTQREIEAERLAVIEECKQELMASGMSEERAQACLDSLQQICLNHISHYIDNKKASHGQTFL